MKCPFCGCQEDKVLDTRSNQSGDVVKRRRECIKCGRRFATYEQIEELRVMIVKKDGRREAFDLSKILKGMSVACEKRPVSMDFLQEKAEDIERKIYDMGLKELPAKKVGDMVADALKEIDLVAYVRFASVYWQFKDVQEFREIVESLRN